MLQDIFNEIINIFRSDHPLKKFFNDIYAIILDLWHYSLYASSDKGEVHVSSVIIGIILFVIGVKFAKYISIVVRIKFSSKLDINISNALERITYYILLCLITIIVLDIANVPLTIFTVIGTIFAVGLGLGSQHIANNFISGLIIMLEQPIKLGDIIETKNIVGQVVAIGARCICIRTEKNIDVLIPNSVILQEVITNWTFEDTMLRAIMQLNLQTKLKIKEVEEMILSVFRDHPYVISKPEPAFFITDFSSKTLAISVEFCYDLKAAKRSKHITDDVIRSLIILFDKYDIKVVNKIDNDILFLDHENQLAKSIR